MIVFDKGVNGLGFSSQIRNKKKKVAHWFLFSIIKNIVDVLLSVI